MQILEIFITLGDVLAMIWLVIAVFIFIVCAIVQIIINIVEKIKGRKK